MRKTVLGFIAAAMAFLVNTAAADVGAIRSIDPCDAYGNVIPAGTIDSSYTVGETAYFRIRLENRNSRAIYNSQSATVKLSNPWRFEYFTGGTPADSEFVAQQWAINPPKVGVFVSGRFTLADILVSGEVASAPWFTDMICAYTVKPGDLALPLTLANSAGNEAADSSTTSYFLGTALNLTSPWRLVADVHESAISWDVISSKAVCEFTYGNYNSWGDPDGNLPASVTEAAGNKTIDRTLFNAGIFVKSIDFDSNTEKDDAGNDVWRAVHENSTSTKEFLPSLSIPGEVASNYYGTVYLWTEDSSKVVLPDAQYEYNGKRVLKLTLDGSPASLQFRIRGVAQNTETDLYLSSTPTNIYSGSGTLIKNFMTRKVACVKPLAPTVSVLVNGASTLTVNCTKDFTNSIPFKIQFTQAWTVNEDVVVNLKYKVNGVEAQPKNLIALSSDQQYGYDEPLPTSITIPANGTESIELDTNPKALYALGALTSSTKGDIIEIIPEFPNSAVAAYFAVKPLKLSLYGMKPGIVSVNGFAPADLSVSGVESPLSLRGGVTSVFAVRVEDTYRNMYTLNAVTGGYKVTWQYEGGPKIDIVADAMGNPLIPDSDGVLNVPVPYPIPTMNQNMFSTVKVTNPDGRSSETSFYVFVKLPKNVGAALAAATVGEGGNQQVKFTLSEAPAAPTLYAFLEPANDTAKNLSYANFFTTNTVEEAARGSAGVGIPFGSGELEAVSDALLSGNGLKFYDNAADHFVYNIRLCTTPVWDPANRVTEFTEGTLVIDVTNNKPVITQVLAKNPVTGLDKLTTSDLVMNVSDPMRTFRVSQLMDVDADKNGTDSKQMVFAWELYQYDDNAHAFPAEPTLVHYTVGMSSTLSMQTIFNATELTDDLCGRYKISIRAQDKDMRGNKPEYIYEEGGVWKYNPWKGLDMGGAVMPVYPEGTPLDPGNDWSDPYEFILQINKNPYVDTNPYGTFTSGTDGVPVFDEKSLLAGESMGFTVAFNAKPTGVPLSGLPVQVTIEAVDNEKNPVAADTDLIPQISRDVFPFKQNSYSNSFAFVDFDGTYFGVGLLRRPQMYRLIAQVTSTATDSNGTPWKDVYQASTNYFRVQNSAPVVTVDPDYAGQDSETNAVMGVTYSPGEHFNFRWSVADVGSDLVASTHGLKDLVVTCSVIGGYEIGTVKNQSSGTFSVWFERPGINKLRITATDKDGDIGYSQVVWFFVETSKNLYLYPYGPSRYAADSASIAKYVGQPGLGVGRVWADGNFGTIQAFRHSWTYNTSSRSATVYAQGYAAGETDESESIGKSTAPNVTGDGTATPHYKNATPYDNFFYRWFKLEPGKGSGNNNNSGSSSSAAAEWTAGYPAPGVTGNSSISFPTEETNYTYDDTMALAIFSRERYTSDNMGDINGDGIPDVFAVKTVTTDNGTMGRLCDIVGSASGGASGGSSGDGAVDSDLVNISFYNGDEDFLPAAASANNPLNPAVKDWSPFRPFDALTEIRGFHYGLNEPGVSDYDLSTAERFALFSDFVKAGNLLTGVDGDDYVAATNWAATAKWTPEAWAEGGVRLNPAMKDTDGDGFDDGWEYYFWYYAKVGAVTNGVWGRLEGRRYALDAPATGTRISPEEIVEAFDPLVRAPISRDTDGDGLTDLEEYILGTNPIDWDSDGDGMSDLWEVLNGLDPLNPGDGEGNPDGDFMARADYADDTFTVYTFGNGEMFALPTKTSPMFGPDLALVYTNVFKLTAIVGGADKLYYAIEAPQHDGTALTADAKAFETVTIGGEVFLANLGEVTIPTGTAVNAAETSDTSEDMTVASAHYKVEKIKDLAKMETESIWFAEKPQTIPSGIPGVMMLAADCAGFETYLYTKDAPFLGASKVFPAGTLVKSVAADPEHIAMVKVPAYEESMTGPTGGIFWRNPVTLETEGTKMALPVFNYGGDGKTFVPCGTNASHYAAMPVVDDEEKKLVRATLVSVQEKCTITLIHNQVFNQFGFDPRTAWNADEGGNCSTRFGAPAANTVPYTSRDEYLVMQYRQELRAIGEKDGIRAKDKSLLANGDDYLVGDDVSEAMVIHHLINSTTYPNLPVWFVQQQYADSSASPFANSTNKFVAAHWDTLNQVHNIHGADTDNDGVPDGWELYVNSDPTYYDDGKSSNDEDGLNLIAEYAGVDSCNAYTNRYNVTGDKLIYPEVESITKNHPGKLTGWWNKFFPTNPFDSDTDGDGVLDDAEGSASWSDTFYIGRNEYNVSFSFIYGMEENAEAYANDFSTTCFRGGGLNPCTVDTDGDLIPDAWEMQFPGIVFKDGEPLNDPGFTELDLQILKNADGKQTEVPATGFCIRGGMDGTWNGDPCLDFDHDGLVNCQEYLVQSLRHLRYDDAYTPLMGMDPTTVAPIANPENGILTTAKFVKFLPFCAWDGEAFHKRCLANGFTGLPSWKFAELGYFTLPPHEWDPIYGQGADKCANYKKSEGAGYRIMLPPVAKRPDKELRVYFNGAMRYASTDPRRWDSDNDGMDDYYELFHGLNPLLGSCAYPLAENEYGWQNLRYDVIGSIYNGEITAWFNHWTGWPTDLVQPAFDAIRYPWMIGTMECDADGDGLRNDEESIKVNVTNPRYTHTDPTPLWMTDSTSPDKASYTAQYYSADPYLAESEGFDPLLSYADVYGLPWEDFEWAVRTADYGVAGMNRSWMFSFEENEGFDTDHNFKNDAVEVKRVLESASDPLDFSDPNRRQALYLPGLVGGTGSAAVSYGGEFRRPAVSEPDFLKQFTVECWVKPDGAASDAVILERVCNYGPSTLSNNVSQLRANFRIGIDGDGRIYGEYEGSTIDSGKVRATGDAIEPNVWTHVAFTFDGNTAALYINASMAPVDSVTDAALMPANGIDGIQQDAGVPVVPFIGYRALPTAFVIGARMLDAKAVDLAKGAEWGDFSSYFKGWVDEVRVWDGARTAVEMNTDHTKRFNLSDVAAIREKVYKAWLNGATRNPSSGTATLPAELIQHYSFASIPGAVSAGDVIVEPTGFQAGVLDNVRRPNGKSLDKSLQVGWWSSSKVKSEVYSNYAVVPWIGNTVAHLPFFDGSCADSQYWSLHAAGVVSATRLMYAGLQMESTFEFPNSANPYPYYNYRRDKNDRYNRLLNAPLLNVQVGESPMDVLSERYRFQLRSDLVGNTDLVPLGGAFARRGSDYWDGQGAMDAWTETTRGGAPIDQNGNGIPDWAEALGYATVEAYRKALAEGLLPDGTVDPAFETKSDINNDGVRDWWQDMYGLKNLAIYDTDRDGLADFVEYLVSEVFKFGTIDPTKAKTNGKEFDYFRKAGKMYLGALFTDHDYMEDWWESKFAARWVSAASYDAHLDNDADGWSNYAECRAGTLPDRLATVGPDGELLPEHPIPLIRAKISCKNAAEISSPIVIQAYSDATLSRADAKWTVPGSDAVMPQERMLGMNPGTGKLSFNLGPGCVVPGSVNVMFRDPAEIYYAGNGLPTHIDTASTEWRPGLSEKLKPGDDDNAYLAKITESVGSVNYKTGDCEIDLDSLKGYAYYYEDGNQEAGTVMYTFYQPSYTSRYTRVDINRSYLKIKWDSIRVAGENKWEFSFSRAETGRVVEGKNAFTAFADLNSNGTWDEGEPFGVVRDVDVGWSGATLDLELTADSPVCSRPSVAAGASETVTNGFTSVYVYRYGIDNYGGYTAVPNTLVFKSENFTRSNLHEGDFLADGNLDIDWKDFKREVVDFPAAANVIKTSVVYRVYSQPVPSFKTNPNLPYVQFIREFGINRAKAVALDKQSVFYGPSPLFRWTIEGERADTFTAFAILVKDVAGTEVWNSGKRLLPPRDVDGSYVWTPPLYAGDQTALGKVFENQANYTWQVSVYNSKFQDDLWSNMKNFRMNAYNEGEVNSSGRFVLNAAVKYYGPGVYDVATGKLEGKIRVEAFTTPDFTGKPAARTFVADSVSVTNAGAVVNATIVGLESGKYYLRAYLDSDGDFEKDPWESWGYYCARSGGESIYQPLAVEVGYGINPGVIPVYLEDTDIDQDCLPDVYEYDTATGDKADFLTQKSPSENEHNGYISVNPNLEASIADLLAGGNPIALFSASAPSRMGKRLAALVASVDSVDPVIEKSTLAVTGLELKNGAVEISVAAAAQNPLAGNTLFVTDGKVSATLVVSYADSLDGNWSVIREKVEFAVQDASAGATFTKALSDLGLDASKGFFKVEIEQ